jgi:hypothetical protein
MTAALLATVPTDYARRHNGLAWRVTCRVEPVAWKPRAFVFHNFMTPEEADHIVSLAKPFVSASRLV